MWLDYKTTCVRTNPGRHLMGKYYPFITVILRSRIFENIISVSDKNQEIGNSEINNDVPKLISKSLYAKIFHEVFPEFMTHLRRNNVG